MVDIDMLKAKISDSGMTIKTISERSGIKRYTLDRKLRGQGNFTADDIVGLTTEMKQKPYERNNIILH